MSEIRPTVPVGYAELLAADLKRAFPDTRSFSPRNLKHMRAFAETWPDEAIVQQLVAQISWGHNVRLLELVNRRSGETHGRSRALLGLGQDSEMHFIHFCRPSNLEGGVCGEISSY